MQREPIRVQVRYSAARFVGMYGMATYAGLNDYGGDDVYRVVFGDPPFAKSAKFHAHDLIFEDERQRYSDEQDMWEAQNFQ